MTYCKKFEVSQHSQLIEFSLIINARICCCKMALCCIGLVVGEFENIYCIFGELLDKSLIPCHKREATAMSV